MTAVPKPVDPGLNLSDPLVKGLIFGLTFIGDALNGPFHDVVRRIPYTMTGGSNPRTATPGPYGGSYLKMSAGNLFVPDLDLPVGVFTVAFIMRQFGVPPFGTWLFQVGDFNIFGSPLINAAIARTSDRVRLEVGNHQAIELNDPTVHNGVWHHLVFQCGSALRIYLDGVLAREGNSDLVYPHQPEGPTARTPTATGMYFVNNANWVDMDSVLLWDRELLPTEIAALAADPYSIFGEGLTGVRIEVVIPIYRYGKVIAVDVIDPGHDYTTATIEFSGGWRNTGELPTMPAGTVSLSGGGVSEIVLSNQGLNFNVAPDAVIVGDGAGAIVRPRLARTINKVIYKANGVKIGENDTVPFNFFWESPVTSVVTATLLSSVGTQVILTGEVTAP